MQPKKDPNQKPVDTVQTGDPGRPSPSELQFEMWVTAMSPWLRMGATIRRSLAMADLTQHKDVVYKKYQDGGWFADRIDDLRSTFGEMANEVAFKALEEVNNKIQRKLTLDRVDTKIIEIASKHRTSQPFFAERTETATPKDKDFGKIIEPATIEYIVPDDPKPDNKEPNEQRGEQGAQDSIPANPETAPGVETPNKPQGQ